MNDKRQKQTSKLLCSAFETAAINPKEIGTVAEALYSIMKSKATVQLPLWFLHYFMLTIAKISAENILNMTDLCPKYERTLTRTHGTHACTVHECSQASVDLTKELSSIKSRFDQTLNYSLSAS